MVLDLKFCRFENVPWGFRLTGGNDFELPLTVIKVSKGSIAEEAGLQVGDVIVRINETATSNLTHSEAHEIITQCGNTFFIGIIRADEEGSNEAESSEEHQAHANGTNGASPYRQIQTPDSQAYSDMSEMTIHTNHTESLSEEVKGEDIIEDQIAENVSEMKIAEIMSGEAEVLKEHNIIGVNFKKIIPKAGLFKSSEVFKQLNEEAMKTKDDKDQEIKKWTTFLQKPNRPVPKSRFDLEQEKQKANAYKVVICKQPKPKCDPNRPPSPVKVVDPEPEPEPQPQPVEDSYADNSEKHDAEYVENLNEDVKDSEIPTLEDSENNRENEEIVEESAKADIQDIPDIVEINEIVSTPSKTEEEIMIEKQLAEVQKQLLALSSLPSTIQATLDAVTKQLAELMPSLKPTNFITATEVEVDNGIQGKEDDEVDTSDVQIDDVEEKHDETDADVVIEEILDEETSENKKNNDPIPDAVSLDANLSSETNTQEEIEKLKMEKVFKKQEEEWLYKKEKEQKRIAADENANRRFPRRLPKELGGPLTPQERPVVLSGGRKWRNERDAFNEDFIAEIISSQAELITGSTLGNTYESPLLPYDDSMLLVFITVFLLIIFLNNSIMEIEQWNKIWSWTENTKQRMYRIRESNCSFLEKKLRNQNEINFLKYKKPEKDLSNLKRSEVFKIIHNMEKDPKHGIQVRPPKVMSEEDVRNRATPIHCT